MSEGTGPGTTITDAIKGCYKLGTVGKKFLGVDIKIDSVNPSTGDGEVNNTNNNSYSNIIIIIDMFPWSYGNDGLY